MRFLTTSLAILACAAVATAAQQTPSHKDPASQKHKAPGVGTLTVPPPGTYISRSSDDCSTPTPIVGSGSHAFDTTAATPSGFPAVAAPCAAGVLTMGKDIFYLWTADANGTFIFDTCGSSYDTKLAVHVGVDCSATCLGYNDDSCGLQSSITVNGVTIGQQLLVQVGGFSSSSGPGVLNIGGPPPPPANDSCATATPIVGAGTHAFNNTAATPSGFNGGGACGAINMNRDLFWVWTADAAGTWIFDTCSPTGFDTKLMVHVGADCTATCLAFNDDSCGLRSSVTINGVNVGDVFLIQVGGFGAGSAGAGVLNIGGPPPPNPADTCSTPEVIAGQGNFPFDQTGATTGPEGQNESICVFFSQIAIANDVWFEWTADATGTATVSTCGLTSVDTKIAVYDGAGCPLDDTAIACNDDACSLQSQLSFPVVAGGVYMIQLGTWHTATPGTGSMDISIVPDPIVAFCFGDGTGTACPCGNDGGSGEGCANGTGAGSTLSWSGSESIVADDLVLSANNLPVVANTFGMFFQGTTQENGGLGNPFGDGLFCANTTITRLQLAPSIGGTATSSVSISTAGGATPGTTLYYQFWYRSVAGPCSSGFNLSSALAVTWDN